MGKTLNNYDYRLHYDAKGVEVRQFEPISHAFLSVHFRGATSIANWFDQNSIWPHGASSNAHWLLLDMAEGAVGEQWISLKIPSRSLRGIDARTRSRLRSVGSSIYCALYWHAVPLLQNTSFISALKQRAVKEFGSKRLSHALFGERDRLWPKQFQGSLSGKQREDGPAVVLLNTNGPIEDYRIARELADLWSARRFQRLEKLVDDHRALAAMPEEMLRDRWEKVKFRPNSKRKNPNASKREKDGIGREFIEWLEHCGWNGSKIKKLDSDVWGAVIKQAFNHFEEPDSDGDPVLLSVVWKKLVEGMSQNSAIEYKCAGKMLEQLLEGRTVAQYTQALRCCSVRQDAELILPIVLAKLLFDLRNSLFHGVIQPFEANDQVIRIRNRKKDFRISEESLRYVYAATAGFLCFMTSPSGLK